jgi:tetratricopeptide (TPR) repeat protein
MKQTALYGWAGMLAAALLGVGIAWAQDEDTEHPTVSRESEMDREIRYATGLMELGLPDFAASVMGEVEKKWPEAKAAAARLRVDSFASQGRFDQAEAEMSKMPSNTVEYMSALLLISDRYYQFNRLQKARQGYETVLGAYGKDGPPAELRRFYMDSAYKFSQMLLNRNDPRGAVKAMRYILVAKPDNYTKRTVSIEMAELLLKVADTLPNNDERKAVLKEATDLCNDVMWEQDLLFGRAIVVLAHAKKMSDSTEGARKLVMDKLPMLESMEAAIRESVKEAHPKVPPEELLRLTRDALRESPMSQCKYLIGSLHEEQGRAALAANKEGEAKEQLGSALGLYFTVIKNYPSSTWAPEACQHIEGIVNTGKERGWSIEVPEGVNMNAVLATRFRDAQSRYADGNYPEAAKYFVQALNVAPNQPEAVPSIGLLAQCYIRDNNEPYARAVIGYLSERYSRDPEKMNVAGNALLGVAQTYQEEGQGPRSRDILLLFTERFSNHDQAPAILMRVGDAALRVTNYVEAAPMYLKVVEKYNRPGRIYNDALSRLALCQSSLNDYSNAVATLKTYLGLLPDNSEKISTLGRIADTYRKMENWEQAATSYATILDLLAKPNNPYSPTAEDRERNKKTRESALFYKGYCYSRMKPAPEEAARIQVLAIDSFNAFLKEFPDSELSPSVLSNVGTLLFLQNRTDEANKVFDTLVKKYPDKMASVYYVQFMSLVDLGRFDKAADVADKMIAEGAKKYTPAQFLTVGNRLLDDGKLPAAALKAFELARSAADPTRDKVLWEQASLGYCKALVASGQASQAVTPLNDMLTRDKTRKAYYVPAVNQLLSQAYMAQAAAMPNNAERTNTFKKAVGALATYRQFLREPGPIADADMSLAKIQLAMGDKRKVLATYQRIFDLKPVDLRTIACIEEAFVNMVPMLLENKRFDVALEAIDLYLRNYKKGKYVVDAKMWRSQLPSDLVARADEAAAVVPPSSETPLAPAAGTAAPPAAVEETAPAPEAAKPAPDAAKPTP